MSTDYVETFVVPRGRHDCTYGIEDFEVPGDHFMPFRYENGECKRFMLWSGGCGIGEADTLEEARQLLQAFIVSQLHVECGVLRETLVRNQAALDWLGGDPFRLGRFTKPQQDYTGSSRVNQP